MHWFELPTPCGAQQQGDIAWNSGAMVITPSRQIFDQMMDQLPRVKKYNVKRNYSKDEDPLNGGKTDQDFITAFFLNRTLDWKRRCVFPAEASILTSTFLDFDRWNYYNQFRPFLYQTVHFTRYKPWRKIFDVENKMICSMLDEWYDSMKGIEEYYNLIPRLNDNAHCEPVISGPPN